MNKLIIKLLEYQKMHIMAKSLIYTQVILLEMIVGTCKLVKIIINVSIGVAISILSRRDPIFIYYKILKNPLIKFSLWKLVSVIKKNFVNKIKLLCMQLSQFSSGYHLLFLWACVENNIPRKKLEKKLFRNMLNRCNSLLCLIIKTNSLKIKLGLWINLMVILINIALVSRQISQKVSQKIKNLFNKKKQQYSYTKRCKLTLSNLIIRVTWME